MIKVYYLLHGVENLTGERSCLHKIVDKSNRYFEKCYEARERLVLAGVSEGTLNIFWDQIAGSLSKG